MTAWVSHPRRVKDACRAGRDQHPSVDFSVYMLASRPQGTLYVGVTRDLVRRVHQHREGLLEGFTTQYGVHRLVWFESGTSIHAAIAREKQLKNWKRDWKIALVEARNPRWDDLYPGLLGGGGRAIVVATR